jgi:hypothetical protein
MCALALACVQGCSFGPVSASSCSVRQGPARSTLLVATLTNTSSKAIRHVGVFVGDREYEYDFTVPLAAGQTLSAIAGSEYKSPEDDLKIACETAQAPRNCAELKRNGFKVQWPAGVPTMTPLHSAEAPAGSVPECSARSIVYADGSVWSVSPM